MSSRLEEILQLRRTHSSYDEELWEFASRRFGRNLVNLSDEDLHARLASIDRNIQYLDSGATPRDDLHPDRMGWLSPWWWLRARYVTTLEYSHRSLAPNSPPAVPAMPRVAKAFNGVYGGGKLLLVRISKVEWLMDTLTHGRLRFSPAASYRDSALGVARADDELQKTYRRPGHAVTITTQDGRRMRAIGDVEFSSARLIESGESLIDVPYWICCFSTDLDPRLLDEFEPESTQDAGYIVIFNPEQFLHRALPELNRIAPFCQKKLDQVNYFDPYFPESHELSAVTSKDFRYAYQREMRLILDPALRPPPAHGGAFFVDIGTLQDIAAVYVGSGKKLAGTGPSSFLV